MNAEMPVTYWMVAIGTLLSAIHVMHFKCPLFISYKDVDLLCPRQLTIKRKKERHATHTQDNKILTRLYIVHRDCKT